MGWSAIILMLIELFGPLLIEWLRKWLEDRLKRAAQRLPAAETFGNDQERKAALFDEVLRDTPRFAFLRRAMLRRMKAQAINPTPEGMEEVRELAGAVAEMD